jgi:hypothetical protein
MTEDGIWEQTQQYEPKGREARKTLKKTEWVYDVLTCLHHEVKKTPRWTPEAAQEGTTCSVAWRNRSQDSDLEVGAEFCFDSFIDFVSIWHK